VTGQGLAQLVGEITRQLNEVTAGEPA
jgi:hypothetical protein